MQVIEIYFSWFISLLLYQKHVEGISDGCSRVDDYEDGAK